MDMFTGHCLCNAIEFTVEKRDLKPADACHCSQCRRWSGHYWAAVNAPVDAITITKGEEALKWYRASGYARRGFCGACGSSLFWHADKIDNFSKGMGVALGALNTPTGVTLTEHIFVADKGDYYKIGDDGLPQKQGWQD